MPGVKKRKVAREAPAPAPAPAQESDVESSTPEQSPEPEAQEQVQEQEEGQTKTFKELGIIEQLCEACETMGYKAPTPIQRESIPLALQGRDLIGLAETGSGKTAAFALPILQALMEKPQPFFGLILAPTRELAYQISKSFESLGASLGVRSCVIVGGMDMVSQSISLGKKPHIIVATPGRLLDHLENTKGFSLRNLKYLVMDEADRLLDMDFGPLLDKILKVLPRERRTFLFSATMSSKVESLQRASLSNPLRVSVSTSKYQTVSTLLQSYLFIPQKHKDLYLVYLLNEFAGQSTIIFTRTVNETQRLAFLLRALGFGAIPLHGQLSQSARLGALGKFRARSRNILVATDVAARGLDIPSVDVVLNFDLPGDSPSYVHRVGRTARAGKSGLAISFVAQYDVEVWLRIEGALGKKLKEYDCPKDEVMVLGENVAEAQRQAIMDMKDYNEKKGGRGKKFGGKRSRDEMDQEEG
ncbi:RNA-dependent ATPase RRP3 [Aspergillus luchuensis]|uniref:ATP-dependent rRNA helicase RRP3 n=3 Tax=Aspergillus subgen. Circumdati TaxID=2720871 RepID=A0A146F6C7_ASPKA|nr:ATP-dependent RNA helicase [Aspergillus tubingensis]XP_041541551.1 ribosomal RNA processing protein [Aspergillus luchuensis]GAA89992.1 ATP-dependent RNA helicase [Aspergillus luchuensis IFO 4308]GAQ44414.1 ATP-dependent RNA helicase [Aspergillus niger]BCR97785.1 ribosomal RNA processing protein [Aspergillus luchuensis]BCS10241.1 ribosomal RNA processing protein [Aspergillus luchuensis]GAT21608.1 ATP-dependent RNA helicase [Aspergillus luchuensis]